MPSNKAKRSNAKMPPLTQPLVCESLESLLDRILAEYIRVSLVPSGRILGSPRLVNDVETIHVKALCHFQDGCPLNFSDFISTAPDISFADAYKWWTLTRI